MIATPFKSRGFNLLELMITVGVATIIVALAPPSFNTVLQSVRLKSQMYDFNGALDFARSEAVKRGTWVTVCASAAQAACGPNGTQWESGWIVFVDPNNNHVVDVGEGPPLRAASALIPTYTLRVQRQRPIRSLSERAHQPRARGPCRFVGTYHRRPGS